MVLIFRNTDSGGAGVADPRRHPYYTRPVTIPTNFSTNTITSNSLNLAFNTTSYQETIYVVSTSLGGPSIGSNIGNFVNVSGLSPGTAYVFYVTAQSLRTFYYNNKPYYTNTSSTVLSTTTYTTAPSAPTITNVTLSSSTSASLSFTSSNGSTTTYTITSNPATSTLTAPAGSSATVYFTSLTGGTSYTFTVTATNSTGSSSATSISYTTVQPYSTITNYIPYGQTYTYSTNTSGVGTSFTCSGQPNAKQNGTYVVKSLNDGYGATFYNYKAIIVDITDKTYYGYWAGSSTQATTVSGTSYTGGWWQIKIPVTCNMTSFTMCECYSTPSGITVAGSTNESTWDLIYTTTNTGMSATRNDRTYNITFTFNTTTNSNYYSYFRFIVTGYTYGQPNIARLNFSGNFI